MQQTARSRLALAHDAATGRTDADGTDDAQRIKEAFARAQAESLAAVAAETRAAWESRARNQALAKAQAEQDAVRALRDRTRAETEAGDAARARAEAEAVGREAAKERE